MLKTSEVYKKLYHYTTWEGLQEILKTQALWATNYKFLNDYSEIFLFRDKLISLIHPHVREGYAKLIKQSPHIKQKINEEGGIDQVIQHDAKAFVNAQYSALREVVEDEIYILSFCGQHKNPKVNNNGLLSQWRGYGTGGGAALVFDTKKMEEILELEAKQFHYSAAFIADLIYSDDEQKLKEDLSDELSIIADNVKQLFNHKNLNQKEGVDVSNGFFPFVTCISRYKHYGFSEENEVRVVSLPTVINQKLLKHAKEVGTTLKPAKERKIRQKNGQRISYIELFKSSDIELPIEKIIVGPHTEKDTRTTALRAMLGKTNIEITCSDIPYVG